MVDAQNVDGTQTSPAAAIANLLVGLFSEYTGRGPTRARAHLHEDIVTVDLRGTLTKAERTLAEHGRSDEVLRMRLAFQQTMRQDVARGVQQILGREIEAFLSSNHLDPDIAVETFLLAPPE